MKKSLIYFTVNIVKYQVTPRNISRTLSLFFQGIELLAKLLCVLSFFLCGFSNYKW